MKKTSFIMSKEAVSALENHRKSQNELINQTDSINNLIIKAVKLEQENKELKRLLELGILKNLHYMRELVRSRGDNILSDFDASFGAQVDDMRETLIKQGIENYE